jgi:intracellular sulfur oxidation DsrE/DsrF family protein
MSYTDPKTKQPPTSNLHLAADGGALNALTKRGLQLAVCQMATRLYATRIAGSGGNVDAVFNELAANLSPNARLVPAGVVTLGRSQERGYALMSLL